MKLGDRLFLQGAFDTDTLAYLRQLGADGVVVNIAGGLDGNAQGTLAVDGAIASHLRDDTHWTTASLTALRNAVEAHGLQLFSLAHSPSHRFQKILFGQPGRDEEIENWCKSLVAMGEAGIPILQYGWHTNVGSDHINWHTFINQPIRGGALAEGFDYASASQTGPTAMGIIDAEQMWKSLTYFLRAVIPVAEKAGVRMAMHPADPQVPSLAGIARIMCSAQSFDRMLNVVPSQANAMAFCQGCFSQMLDPKGVYDAITHFGDRKAIALVHFRNVSPDSRVARFTEAFWDDGKVDMHRAMQAYRKAGFDGYFIPDHHPHVTGDSVWGHRSRAFALGYIRALIQSTQKAP